MPPTLTFPGVYVDEIPTGGARPIAAVPTAIAAFVGPVPQGPTDVVHITSLDDFERQYGRVQSANPVGIAVHQFFDNGGSEAKIVRVVPKPAAGDPPAGGPAPSTLPLGADAPVLQAKTVGVWGDQLRARVDGDIGSDPPERLPDTLYNLTIRDVGNKREERYLAINIDPKSPQSITEKLKGSQLVSVKATGTARPQESPLPEKDGQDVFGDTTKAKAGPAPAGGAAPEPKPMFYKAAGGNDGGDNPTFDYDAAFRLLRKADIWNLLCVLPAAHGKTVGPQVQAAGGRLCIDRRAFFIVDPPADWVDVPSAVRLHDAHPLTGTEFAKSAAVYFPRLRIPDPSPTASGVLDGVGPCGALAGVFARTDAQRGVWKAPAGTAAGFAGVDSFTVEMNDPENGRLNPLGVNCLRSFPGLGKLSWGARTMAGADAQLDDPSWRYVPIRRLALFMEESLFIGTKWVVFEPNDEPLWSSIRLSVGAFMNRLFRQGAFQGRTPKDAYLVKCDRDNNPQDDIDRGIVNILVGFAPLKPAEFVLLHIQQLPGDVQA